MTLPRISDRGIERIVSVVLRSGVLLSASVVLAGGIYYLIRHGEELADYRTFRGQPSVDRYIEQIVEGAVQVRARSIIQAGILLLIATPILRVAVSLAGFALERDGKYVLITSIVLLVLLYSVISGAGTG
jgi:uncharacterized membrane protein